MLNNRLESAMRMYQMFKYLETENPVELISKMKAAVKDIPEDTVYPRVADMLRKEIRSLSFMASNVEYGVMMGTAQKLARTSNSF
jgi:hypothetical protein